MDLASNPTALPAPGIPLRNPSIRTAPWPAPPTAPLPRLHPYRPGARCRRTSCMRDLGGRPACRPRLAARFRTPNRKAEGQYHYGLFRAYSAVMLLLWRGDARGTVRGRARGVRKLRTPLRMPACRPRSDVRCLGGIAGGLTGAWRG